MPRKRRNDSAEAPIDGDYRFDVLVDEGGNIVDERRLAKMPMRYAFLHPEDVPRKKIDGYRKVTRVETGGVRPLYDAGDPADAGYKLGQLELYEIPRERKERADARATTMAADRHAAVLRDVQAHNNHVTEDRRSVRV